MDGETMKDKIVRFINWIIWIFTPTVQDMINGWDRSGEG